MYIFQFNGLSGASNKIQKVLNDIVLCDANKASELSKIKLILIITGAAVILLCLSVIIPLTYYVQNRSNFLWNQLKTVAIDDSNDLMQIMIERLQIIHNEQSIIENTTIKDLLNSETIKFSYIFKYISRIAVFFLLTLIFYILSNFFFYISLETALIHRPDLLSNLIHSRINLSKLDFWTKEVLVDNLLDLKILYGDYIPVNIDYKSELQDTIDLLHSEYNSILFSQYYILLGENLRNSFIYDNENILPIMRFGSISAINSLVFDAYFIAKSIANPNIISEYLNFNTKIRTLGSENETKFQEIVVYSKGIIEEILGNYMTFSICFFMLILLIYLLYYHPYFTSEQKKIEAMCEISQIFTCRMKFIRKT